MDKKFRTNLISVGAFGVIASVIWWFYFYSKVNHFIGRAVWGESAKCLIINTGPCGFIKGIASAAGEFPYEPMLLWISAGAVVVGLISGKSSRT